MSERMLHGLDFGLDHTGRMRGIDEVEQGLACKCECPECGSPLVARPEFDSSKAHFRPTPSNGAGFRAMGRQKPRYTGC